MRYNIFIFAMAAILVSFVPDHSLAQLSAKGQAGLIINPTRVVLEGRHRSASISISNNGDVAGDYKIELVNKYMDENGKLVNTKARKQSDMFADKILRISPRRVTVAPGDTQNVRILVRKPKNLPEGEYRSHLSVLIIPEQLKRTNTDDIAKDNLVIAIKANYGVTIPVIVRNGKLSSAGQIDSIKYVPSKGEEKAKINFNIHRDGKKSLYGDINIIHKSAKGKEKIIKFMGGIAVYTPNTNRHFSINLDDEIKGGTVKVTYQEKDKDGGKIIAEGEIKI